MFTELKQEKGESKESRLPIVFDNVFLLDSRVASNGGFPIVRLLGHVANISKVIRYGALGAHMRPECIQLDVLFMSGSS